MTSDISSSICVFFPPEIIIEILSRLPVKALGRFSTVSKSWCSLIKSRMFINEHLKSYRILLANKPYRKSECQSGHVLVMHTSFREQERHPWSLYCDSTFVEHEKFDIPTVFELFRIVNSCNGIICLTERKHDPGRKVCLYNPSIRKLKFTSDSCFPDAMYDSQRVYPSHSRFGFGFSELTNDFKVVRICYTEGRAWRILGDVAPEVEVYSVNAGGWRRISANLKCIVYDRSVCCNGSMYWLACRTKDLGCDACDAIMCFDISREVFSEIELPVRYGHIWYMSLLVFKGSLALFKKKGYFCDREWYTMNNYELWVMSQYNGAESWTRLKIFRTEESVRRVFGFTNSGILVVEMKNRTLATWDPERNFVVHPNIDAYRKHVDPAFVESLVLYDQDGCVDSVQRN